MSSIKSDALIDKIDRMVYYLNVNRWKESGEFFMKVAVVHMKAVFGNVDSNLDYAEKRIREASENGAELILFPEFFTTGFSFSNKLYEAVLNYENPQKKICEYASKYNIIIGGSYLNLKVDSEKGNDVYNTFTLTFPDGSVYKHSKDIPTIYEHYIYNDGDENNVLETPIGNIGVAICWEQIRYNTLKRMAGKVDFILGLSCWWGFSENDPEDLQNINEENNKIALNAPVEIAKKLKVPVLHSSYNNDFTGVTFPKGDVSDTRRIYGASQIIDRNGNVILRKMYDEEPEILYTSLEYDIKDRPKCTIDTEEYWVPKMPQMFLYGWDNVLPKVEEYYNKISRPRFQKKL